MSVNVRKEEDWSMQNVSVDPAARVLELWRLLGPEEALEVEWVGMVSEDEAPALARQTGMGTYRLTTVDGEDIATYQVPGDCRDRLALLLTANPPGAEVSLTLHTASAGRAVVEVVTGAGSVHLLELSPGQEVRLGSSPQDN
jgi:hypothetical protein